MGKDAAYGSVVVGKLNLKGKTLKTKGAKKKKKKSKQVDHRQYEEEEQKPVDWQDTLTPAQKRHLQVLDDRETIAKAMAKKTHRDKINEFNDKLGSLTEHNDIPRISAAGNG